MKLDEIQISNKKIKSILNDAEKTAKAVNLIYVHDNEPGIKRIITGKKINYLIGNKTVKDKILLDRINKLVIPPAWENVWICELENGHLQVTGTDLKKRKQYKYHNLWNALRNQTKFYRLHEFGKTIPQIREQIEKDLLLSGLPLQKVLATIVSLMERTSIRIGNQMYEKLYGSYGLTTLKDKHVNINGANMQFMFKGKKGVSHNISIKSKRLANIVKNCRDIPGKELFQYIDETGNHKSVDSGMVNTYIKTITNKDFTAKDFRTWAGTVHSILAFKELGMAENQTEAKKKIVTALDSVAKQLGNTRTVCRKYYVHPIVISLFETNKLNKYLDDIESNKTNKNELEHEEKILMNILEKEGLVIL